MKIPTISRQMCGDINAALNARRKQMNDEVAERIQEHLKNRKSEQKANVIYV